MSDVKKIKVGSASYDCKDATARTQVERINLTKSGNDLVFTDSNGTQHTMTAGSQNPFTFVWTYSPNRFYKASDPSQYIDIPSSGTVDLWGELTYTAGTGFSKECYQCSQMIAVGTKQKAMAGVGGNQFLCITVAE